jgi:hypothetical protein
MSGELLEFVILLQQSQIHLIKINIMYGIGEIYELLLLPPDPDSDPDPPIPKPKV